MTFDYDEELTQQLIESIGPSDRALVESFESMNRLLDSVSALGELIQTQGASESFESSYRPLLTAIYAGTNLDVDEMDVSLESASETLKKLWKAFIQAIRSFFKNLYTYLTNMDLAATWLSRQIAVIERKIIASRGKVPGEAKVQIGPLARYLRYGRLFADDALKLDTELSHLHSVLEIVRAHLVPTVLDHADKIPATVGNHRGAELDRALTQMVLSMPLSQIATKMHMTAAPQSRFNRSNVLMTPPLLGGSSVFYLQGKLVEKGTRGFRFHGMVYDRTTEEIPVFAVSHDFRTLSPQEITRLPQLLRDILKSISKSTNQELRSRIARTEKALETFLTKSESNEALTSSDIELIRRTTTSFTYWTHSVLRPMCSTSISVCRASIAYCNESFKTFN